MTEEFEVAESAADAIKGMGLRKYLWLYFFVVPLAAATASSVAVGIAALQGLGEHPSSPAIHAGVLLVSAKLVAVFAGGYSIGLLLALLTGFARHTFAGRNAAQSAGKTKVEALLDIAAPMLQRGTLAATAIIPVFRILALADERETLILSVLYAVLAIAIGFIAVVLPDLRSVYGLIEAVFLSGAPV